MHLLGDVGQVEVGGERPDQTLELFLAQSGMKLYEDERLTKLTDDEDLSKFIL